MRAFIPVVILLIVAACASSAQVALPPIPNTVSREDSAAVLPTLRAMYPEAVEEPDIPPYLEGGPMSIMREIVYPAVARHSNIHGRVHLSFVIDEEGNVVSPMVTRGIGGGCDEEAMRVIRTAKFIPGRHNGKPVQVIMSWSTDFRLK